MKQEETNALLVQKAKEGKVVARLKGGDRLFLAEAARKHLPFEPEGIGF